MTEKKESQVYVNCCKQFHEMHLKIFMESSLRESEVTDFSLGQQRFKACEKLMFPYICSMLIAKLKFSRCSLLSSLSFTRVLSLKGNSALLNWTLLFSFHPSWGKLILSLSNFLLRLVIPTSVELMLSSI